MMNILPIYQANTQRRAPRRETERELLMRVAKEQQREERRERRSAIVRRVTGRRDEPEGPLIADSRREARASGGCRRLASGSAPPGRYSRSNPRNFSQSVTAASNVRSSVRA